MQAEVNREQVSEQFKLFQGGTGGLDSWLSDTTLGEVFDVLGQLEEQPLSRALLNQLLTLGNEAPISDGFFRYYWLSVPDSHPYNVRKVAKFEINWAKGNKVQSLDQLYWGLYRFYIDALLYFGSIRTGFQRLREMTSAQLIEYFGNYHFDSEELKQRGLAVGLNDIAIDNRYLISEMACKSFEAANVPEGELASVLLELYQEHKKSGGGLVTPKQLLTGAYDKGQYKNRQMQFDFSADEFLDVPINAETELLTNLESVARKFEQARRVALSNTRTYLSMVGALDVYLATSMRSRQDFRDIARFCQEVFHSQDLKEFQLRYFDPTTSAAAHHEDKGLIECLMVKCAKVLVLYAGSRDSYGKDAEAAMALSLGKPVIIYADEEYRSSFFQDVHPLSRLIQFETGVANGAMVATSVEDVSEILKRILNNDMEYVLEQTHPKYLVLKEKVTESVVRLQTSDDLLRETFWNHYHSDLH